MVWPFRSSTRAPIGEIKSAGVSSQGFLPTLGSVPSASGALVSQATAITVPTVYACVSIRAEDVARCAPRLYRPLADGSREEVKEHPVARLFRRPNAVQNWFEFAEQMTIGLLLRGNAYAVILRDRRGRPQQLIPVNPDAVTVLEAADGQLFYNVSRVGLFQIAALRDQPQSIPAEDIFHLRGMAFNATVGLNRLGVARDAVGLSIGLMQQAARWMNNGARPSGVLQTDKSLTQQAADRLKASWNSLFSGIQNVGAVAVLEEGLEWKPMSLTSVDLQFIEQRKLAVLDICQWFRIPPHKVGVVDANAKLNQAQADQSYVNETIMPDLERWEQKFVQTFDLDAEGLEVDFDESSLLRADIMTRINIGRLGVMSGLLSPNEWRKSEKLAPVAGGDQVLAPVNLAALGSDLTGTAPDGAGRPSRNEENPAP